MSKLKLLKRKLQTAIKLIGCLPYQFYRSLCLINFRRKKVELPYAVRIDASTLCQLNCRGCYMRKGNYHNRGAGYLKFNDFERFLEMNPFVKNIELSNNGEIFLNPDLLKIIQLSHSKGVKLTAANGANFNNVSDEMLEALVKYEFQYVTIAIDGASQETYSWYRRNGNFDKVIDNIKKLNEYKKKYNSGFPSIAWQYIIFESNQMESEIKKAKEMAKSLNCAAIVFAKDNNGFIPDDLEMIERETGLCYNDIFQRLSVTNWLFCLELWTAPQINWDGRLFGCCVNLWEDFGLNVFDLGLEECLNSKIVRRTKRMLMGGIECGKSPCKNCWIYRKIVQERSFVTEDEIKKRGSRKTAFH